MLKENGRLWILNASKTEIKEPIIDGWENITDEPCVVATTHLSGIDPREIARVLADRRNVTLAVDAANLSSPRLAPWFYLLGRDNFLPISTTDSHLGKEMGAFTKSINEQGKTIVISAYLPKKSWQLPEKGGLAAVVLAHAAKVNLVPAAMTYESPDVVARGWDLPKRAANIFKNQRSATAISFCEPINLVSFSRDEIDQTMRSLDRNEREKLSDEQKRIAHANIKIWRAETAQVMSALASKVPQELHAKYINRD